MARGTYIDAPGVGERIVACLRRNRTADRSPKDQTELAAEAGISRQTLSLALQDRVTARTLKAVAKALDVPQDYLLRGTVGLPATLTEPPRAFDDVPGQWEPEPDVPDEGPSAEGIELEDYVSNMDLIVRTLRTTPGGPLSIQIKLALLDGVKGAAADAGATLPREYYEIRRRVMSGEL